MRLFPAPRSKSISRSQVHLTPGWYIAWGNSPQLDDKDPPQPPLKKGGFYAPPLLRGAGGDRPFDGGRETGADISWRDAQLTIFHEQPVFSLSQRFAVLGDLWLSNCDPLRDRLGVAPIPDAQLVAHLWERWGVDALGLLEGIFALVVWGREYLKAVPGSRSCWRTTEGSLRWIAPRLRLLSSYHSHELDLVALRDYLCCAFVPGDRTLWRYVRELRPGTFLTLPDNSERLTLAGVASYRA